MSTDKQRSEEFPEEVSSGQPADPFEPEAPAHVDPDAEAVAHQADVDEEAAVDEADTAEQPIGGDRP